MNKIFVLRQGALGDVILTTPIIRKLKSLLGQDSSINVLTAFPFVFDNNPHVDKVYSYGQYVQIDSADTVIDLNLVYEKNPGVHIIDAYDAYVNKMFGFGDTNFDKQPELFLSSSQQDIVNKEISTFGDNYVVIHMRKYGWPNRNFGEAFWQEVVREILQKTDYKIVQIGAKDEIAFSGNPRLIDFRGKYDIQVARGIIDAARALIGTDTGVLHIAACTSTPIISAFTSAHHDYRKPLRNDSIFFPILPKNNDGIILECYGCQKDEIPPQTDFRCRRTDVICNKSIRVEDIIEQLLTIK